MDFEGLFDRHMVLCGRELSEIYKNLALMAEEFAVMGYVRTASDLVGLLLGENWSEWQLQGIRHLAFPFAESGLWPDNVEPEWKAESGLRLIEDSFAQRRGVGHWGTERDLARTKEKLLALAAEGDSRGASKMYKRLGVKDSTGAVVMALSLAVQQLTSAGKALGEIEMDDEVQEILTKIEHRMSLGDPVRPLLEQRNLWPLLMYGAMRRKIGVDENKMAMLSQEVVSAHRERFGGGRQQSFLEELSIPDLIHTISENTQYCTQKDGQELPPPIIREPPPDIDERIRALEQRVGETLPEDYKEFLRTSNGLGEPWGRYFIGTSLYGVDEVDWADVGFLEDAPLVFHEEPSGRSSIRWEPGRWPVWRETKALALSCHPFRPWSTLLIPPKEARRVFEAYDYLLYPPVINGEEEDTSYLLTEDADPDMIAKVLETKFGDWQEKYLKNDSWLVMRDNLMIRGIPFAFGSFRTYLEGLANESKDVQEQGGWFSYKCLSDHSQYQYAEDSYE